MAYEDKTPKPQASHKMTMDERERLWISGVQEVESFDEEAVAIQTVKGLLYVRGSDLKVDKLEKNTGELTISGQIASLDYEDTGPKSGFWSRLFH